ncbi:ionotropic receptor 21a-like [Panulirus ornatus]|uniref:ionotropic receptor 21a-like n=1 Tax=Panulirus ornatus TaxID=150431 RepID=UPI003A87A2AD
MGGSLVGGSPATTPTQEEQQEQQQEKQQEQPFPEIPSSGLTQVFSDTSKVFPSTNSGLPKVIPGLHEVIRRSSSSFHQSGTEGEWLLYMNQLYWGPGVRRINTWYHHRFSRQLDLFPDKLSDLQGAVLKVSTFHFAPCNFFHRAENGTVMLRYGMETEVVKTVARVLNFTLEFTEPPNGENWGEMYENGSWYGLMGQLQRREVDIGLANWFISTHWLQAIDLTSPYRTEVMIFMTLTEPPLPHWQALAFPFHQWTWLAVLVGIIVSGPLLFLLARASDKCGGELTSLQSLSYSWYYAFGVHFCRTHTSLPRSISTQVFVMFLWLYTMILTMVYSANLKSFLLVKKQPSVMQTLQDLHESGLEVASGVELYKYEFAMSSNPYLQGMTRVYKYYDSMEKLLPPVLQGRSVSLSPYSYVDFIIKTRFTKQGNSRFRIMKVRDVCLKNCG